MKTAFQIFSVVIFIAIFFLFKTPKNASAQSSQTATCTITSVVVNGQQIPYDPIRGVPSKIAFSFNINCAPSAQYTFNLTQLTSPTFTPQIGSYVGTGSGKYGPWGPYDASIIPYRLYFQASLPGGQILTPNCTNCDFRVQDGVAIPSPSPSPSPSPPPPGSSACPPSSGTFNGSYRYSPDPPPLNQPFQVQFNVPTNGTNVGMLHFKLTNSVTSKTTDVSVVNAASSYGVWFAPIPAQSNQASWQLFSDVLNAGTTVTCSNGTMFNGIGVTTTSSGNNPCTAGPSGFCSTAIGNVPISLGDFATAVLRIALGISGGIVLILMVIGSIRVMTSSGDPQRVAAGRDMIVAAIAGALFIAFSVMIMQFLGTAIVPIPGLTFGT